MPSAATDGAVIDIDDGAAAAPALPATDRLLLRPEEAAAALAIGRTKLYELLSTGAIPSVQIGSARRVPADALREFVAALHGRTGPEPQPPGGTRTHAGTTAS